MLSLSVAVPYPRRKSVFPSEGRVSLHEHHPLIYSYDGNCTRKCHMRIEFCVKLGVLYSMMVTLNKIGEKQFRLLSRNGFDVKITE